MTSLAIAIAEPAVLELTEHTPVTTDLGIEDLRFLIEDLEERISVSRPISGDGYVLNSRSNVGVVVLPSGLRITCEPKIPISNLMYMLGVANRLPDLARQERAGFKRIEQVFDLISAYFAGLVETRLRTGLFRRYTDQTDNLPYVRGQIVFREDMLRNSILRNKVFCEFSEFTADIAENQVLRQVCRILSGVSQAESLRKRFRHLDGRLGDLKTGSFSGDQVRAFRYNRFNIDYVTMHILCALFIEQSSLSERDGSVQSGTFLMDMNSLFESFITQALIDRTPSRALVSAQDRAHLDVDNKVRLRPDVVTYFQARPNKVLDCKYKVVSPDSFINTDVYQVLAYTRSYNVDEGIIVYPASEVSVPDSIRVRHDGPLIRQFTVNLDGEKSELERDLAKLANAAHSNMPI